MRGQQGSLLELIHLATQSTHAFLPSLKAVLGYVKHICSRLTFKHKGIEHKSPGPFTESKTRGFVSRVINRTLLSLISSAPNCPSIPVTHGSYVDLKFP